MPTATPPPYLSAVLALSAGAPPGEVSDVFVLHDADCPLLHAGGACACTPEVTRGFVLYHRPNRKGAAWAKVSAHPTEAAARHAMRTSTRGSGRFRVVAAGKRP